MTRLRVALLAAEFLPNWGGAGTYNVRLVQHLKEKVEFHVITLRRQVPGSDVTYSREEVERRFDGLAELHELTEARDTFVYNAKFQWAVARQLPRLHRQFGFDLVHTDHPHMADLLCQNRLGVPTVTTVHTTIGGHLRGIRASGLRFSQVESSERYQKVLDLPLGLIERHYLRRCRQAITVSDWMRRELARDYPRMEIAVIRSGVDIEEFVPGNPAAKAFLPDVREPVVLVSSRMTAAKGGGVFIEAMARVLAKTQNVHFAFAGSSLEEPWRSLIERLGIGRQHYTFLGYLPYERLAGLYGRASVYVCPSLWENLPARVLEAMACGVPVIATEVCGVPEAVRDGENGLLVRPGDADALAEAMLRLLGDADLRQRLADAGRRTVEKEFNWRNVAAATLGVYERVCASQSSRL